MPKVEIYGGVVVSAKLIARCHEEVLLLCHVARDCDRNGRLARLRFGGNRVAFVVRRRIGKEAHIPLAGPIVIVRGDAVLCYLLVVEIHVIGFLLAPFIGVEVSRDAETVVIHIRLLGCAGCALRLAHGNGVDIKCVQIERTAPALKGCHCPSRRDGAIRLRAYAASEGHLIRLLKSAARIVGARTKAAATNGCCHKKETRRGASPFGYYITDILHVRNVFT